MKIHVAVLRSGALALCLALVACAREGPAERAGKQIDDAIAEAQDRLEEAGEEVAEAADELAAAAGEARAEFPGEMKKEAKELKKGIREACEDLARESGARNTDC